MSLGRIGNYEILERIGEGGMGVVFQARDLRLDRVVAIKVLAEELAQDPEQHRRLMHEARTLAALNHPNIATCFDFGEARPEPPDLVRPGAPGPHPDQVAYLAMEHVPGLDLADPQWSKPLPLAKLLDLAIQIISALEAAHRAGVVHRDLKPRNIRVTPSNQIKVLDFGLARSQRLGPGRPTSSTSNGTVVGTVGYMSPEQAEGCKADFRSDLFSYGVILYELVTGHAPFEGQSVIEVLYAIANQEPQPLARYASNVPPELERIVRKLLAKDRDDRYQSAHDVVTDLRRLRETMPASSRFRPPIPHPLPGRSAVLVGLGLAMLGAASLGWEMWNSWSSGRRVAVVGFQNLTGDASLDYLGAGLSTDLLNELVQHTRLVVAPGALRDGKGRPVDDAKAIAREFGVGRVITGAVRPTAAGLKLSVQVLDGRRGYVRWAGDFAVTPSTLPEVRRSVLKELFGRLATTPAAAANLADGGPPSVAYEEYLRGLSQVSDTDDPLARDRAIASFERAIALDSTFALAWAGAANALSSLYDRDHAPALLQRAGNCADRAVELGPDLVQAHLARARVLNATGRTRDAIEELQQGLAINPNNDEAHSLLGYSYRKVGDLERAGACYRKAVALRPGSWSRWVALGNFLYGHADYSGARSAYQMVVRLAPERNRGYQGLGDVSLSEGRYAEAIALYGRLPRPTEVSAALASNIATAHFFENHAGQALKYYLESVSLEPADPMYRQNLGDCYARLGRTALAREQYREFLRLTRIALWVNPDSPQLKAQLILSYAKAGQCDSAATRWTAEASSFANGDAQVLHPLAKAYALCGRAPEAVAALGKIVQLGSPPDLFRDEDEFKSLHHDPRFVALVSGGTRRR